ncbi:MAG: hypothetical protein LQ343_001998 [Gyalolechia ehrenbergii]|nr:MAG: hypothetical protein LQ343_001998 [Gyalolechia ehrenbergii]
MPATTVRLYDLPRRSRTVPQSSLDRALRPAIERCSAPASAWVLTSLSLALAAIGLHYLRKLWIQPSPDVEAAAEEEKGLFQTEETSSLTSIASLRSSSPTPLLAPYTPDSEVDFEKAGLNSDPRLQTLFAEGDPRLRLPVGMARWDRFERVNGSRRHTIVFG